MVMKLGKVLELNETLKIIIDDNTHNIDNIVKFKLLGVMSAIENCVINFEIIQNEVVSKYGKKDDTGVIKVLEQDKESYKKAIEEINRVINSDVEFNLKKLKSNEFLNSGIPAKYLAKLYDIMEE